MSQIAMATIMDAITSTLTSGGRTEAMYPFPADAIVAPCWVVGYPKNIDYDETFGRGSDRAVFPVWHIVARNDPRSTRDALSAVIAGASSIKTILDGTLGGAVQTCRVTDCQPTFIEIGGVPYAAGEFTLEVLT